MYSEGFTKNTYDNGLVIWHRNGNINKSNAIIFLHAGSGGLVAQMSFIKKIPKTHTVVIPEIPGISFGNRVFIPPTIREISKEIIKFIIKIKSKELQLISHSFGGNIVSCIINNYADKLQKNNIMIVNTTLIEPVIFLPSLLQLNSLLNFDINTWELIKCLTSNIFRIVSYILIFRDIYIQYYTRCLTMTDVLMGATQYEKKNSINIIFAENDELYSAKECENYLKSKDYNCNIITIKDAHHGDFCFDEKIHKTVIDLIV
jgi:hypothetical protein